jgi:hypothetical protein
MRWKNTRNDGTPKDKEQVLICFDGVYHIADYSETGRVFVATVAGEPVQFPVDDRLVYWTELRTRRGGGESREKAE